MTTEQPNAKLTYCMGDITQDAADIHVVPINCVPGVMGAGLAKVYANWYPGLSLRHRLIHSNRDLRLYVADAMKPYLVDDIPRCHQLLNRGGRALVMFPTKDHWKDPSRLDRVYCGLANLYDILERFEPENPRVTIAMPALGCGLGGLAWKSVQRLVAAWSEGLSDHFHVNLYMPHK